MAEIFDLIEIKEVRKQNSLDEINKLTEKRRTLFYEMSRIAMLMEKQLRRPKQYKKYLESKSSYSKLMHEADKLRLELHKHEKQLAKLD